MRSVHVAFAVVLAASMVVPSVLAHEEHETDPGAADPLAPYRDSPWYSIVDDHWWFYGAAEKHVPLASLPLQPYQSGYETDADGDWIVWIDASRPGGDVFAYNVEARSGLYLTDDPAQQHDPVVRGNVVAWEDYRDGQAEIYMYDLERSAAALRVTNSTSSQRNPAVGDGWIVYEDRSAFANGTDLWIYRFATGKVEPLVAMPGDQSMPAFAGDHVVFRDEQYGQSDVMAVRIAGGKPSYLTRSVDIETAPTSSGTTAFFMRSFGGAWRLMAFDGLRNVTRDTGIDLQVTSRMDIERGILAYTTYRTNGNYVLNIANLQNGMGGTLSEKMPVKGPVYWVNGKVATFLAGDHPMLIVVEPSEFVVSTPARLTIVGPPEGAPFTSRRGLEQFVANGTFRTNPVWGQPLRFEYRFDEREWTAFDAKTGEWNVTVDIPRGYKIGDKPRFQIRAVFADAPSVGDTVTMEYARLVFSDIVTESPPEPWTEKLKRAVGAIVLGFIALVFLALLVVRLVLRGTLRRLVQRRVEAEYVRPDEPQLRPR